MLPEIPRTTVSAAAAGRGANGPHTAVICLLLSFASPACGRVGFERLQRDGGVRQGFDASVDASGFDGGAPDDTGPGEDSGPADAGAVVDGATVVGCTPTEMPDCGQGAANVFPTGLTSMTLYTGAQADQWRSSCGGADTGDFTLELTVERRGTYRFEFSGGADAAISIRDADCAGPELACGLGAVEVSADTGQILLVHVEGAADSTCISGEFTYMGI